jgi:oxepin-CoA hydrolase/3-oxo-5,6-dehydrosuberyl-CoA semialdehyde dehydrogenase
MSIKVTFDVNDAELRDEFLTQKVPEALALLQEDTKPEWGKMGAQHMVEHLLLIFEISTGKLKVPCKTPEEKLRKMKAFLHLNRPMPKGFQNPLQGDEPPDLQYQNFDEVVEKLTDEIRHFLRYYKENPDAIHTNPTFDDLGAEEWHKFHFKHCFHHLNQFGVIEKTS